MPSTPIHEPGLSWTKISEEDVSFNKFNKQVHKEYKLPNGAIKKAYVGKPSGYVVGLALTPENNVVVCREYRPGPDAIMMDMPTGMVEEGEDPVLAMGRELLEETGYAGEIVHVNTTLVGPWSAQRRHTFVITGCKKVSDQDLDDDEFIEVREIPLQEFAKIVLAGETTNSPAFFFALNKLGLLSLHLGDRYVPMI
jgi:ADP-ribose pyrophosphatase